MNLNKIKSMKAELFVITATVLYWLLAMYFHIFAFNLIINTSNSVEFITMINAPYPFALFIGYTVLISAIIISAILMSYFKAKKKKVIK